MKAVLPATFPVVVVGGVDSFTTMEPYWNVCQAHPHKCAHSVQLCEDACHNLSLFLHALSHACFLICPFVQYIIQYTLHHVYIAPKVDAAGFYMHVIMQVDAAGFGIGSALFKSQMSSTEVGEKVLVHTMPKRRTHALTSCMYRLQVSWRQ